MPESVDVTLDELNTAIRLWIRGAPPWVWKRDLEYERLKLEGRQDPQKAPDPQRDLAAFLTDKFAQVGWVVSRKRPENIFTDRLPGDIPSKEGE